VAFRALHLGVLELQGEGALSVVVESGGFPRFFRVALRAAKIQLSRMVVLVAGHALFLAQFGEEELGRLQAARAFFLFEIRPFNKSRGVRGRVALFALELFVRADEFVLGLVVVKGQTLFESLRIMAERAGLGGERPAELVDVDVFMTINAELRFGRFEFKDLLALRSMAVVALGIDVRTGQREAGFIVIKTLAAFQRVPGIRGVADGAFLFQQFLAENPDVDVLMAVLTRFLIEQRVSVNGLPGFLVDMAVFALQFQMRAINDVTGVDIVVKIDGWLPDLFRMAAQAVVEISEMRILGFAETMEVFVAGQTLGLQAQPLVVFRGGALQDRFSLFVALGAFDLRVAAIEFVARDLMIEARDFPFLLRVAGRAIAPLVTAREGGLVDVLMAGQALGGF